MVTPFCRLGHAGSDKNVCREIDMYKISPTCWCVGKVHPVVVSDDARDPAFLLCALPHGLKLNCGRTRRWIAVRSDTGDIFSACNFGGPR